MASDYNATRIEIEQAVHEVSCSIGRLCDLAKSHPRLVCTEIAPLSNAGDELAELIIKLLSPLREAAE